MISEIREQIERELSRVFPRFRKKKLSLLALEIVWVSVQLRYVILLATDYTALTNIASVQYSNLDRLFSAVK